MHELDCLLISDPPAAGSWNMALDEGLLEAAAHGTVCALRFYAWAEPTLSLGYFQNHRDRLTHTPSLACPLVRRPSGGGAILHDRELTYSIALPPSHPLSRRPDSLYRAVHKSLIELLSGLGVAASMYPADPPRPHPDAPGEPFLCFQRRVDGDVIMDGYKIAGSAQRRRHQAVLQHGSVLLQRSPFAPELPGIAELTGRALSPDALRHAWFPRLATCLGARLQTAQPDQTATTYAASLCEARYETDAWNLKR